MNFMKTCLLAASFLLPAGDVLAAGAFGIELGSSVAAYALSGNPVEESGNLKMYELKPPHPDGRFDTYAVDAWNGRIVRIMASSPDDASPDGASTLGVYHQLRKELAEKYGEPSLRHDDVDDAGADLRDYLVDEGGIEVLEWDMSVEKDDGCGSAYVFLAGCEDGNGRPVTYCTLYLESPDYPALSENARQEELQKESSAESGEEGRP